MAPYPDPHWGPNALHQYGDWYDVLLAPALGEEHLPRDKHLTFANASGTRVLAFGVLYAVADLRQAADELLRAADHDDELASRLVATHEQLVTKQSKALVF